MIICYHVMAAAVVAAVVAVEESVAAPIEIAVADDCDCCLL